MLSNIFSTYQYTPCKLTMNIDGFIGYITENFSYDIGYMTDFLHRMNFGNVTSNKDYPFVNKFYGRGENLINIVTTNSEYDVDNDERNVSICDLSKDLIDKINTHQLGNNMDYKKL